MTRRNVLPPLPIWILQKNLRLCLLFSNCRTSPHLKPYPRSGHGSILLAPVSAPSLHRHWGVELNGPEQGGHGLHVVYWCLLLLLTTVVRDKPAARTWLSYYPLKTQWLFRRDEDFESCHWVLLQHQSVANRSLCTVSSHSPRNLYGKEIFPL